MSGRIHITCPHCQGRVSMAVSGVLPHSRRRKAPSPSITDEQIAARYHAGETLEQLGDVVGVTRERIRQRLKRIGVSYMVGGRHELLQASRLAARVENRQLKRAEYERRRGFTPEQREAAINEGFHKDAFLIWQSKRQNILREGGEWNLTYLQWLQVWKDSGRIAEHGKDKHGAQAIMVAKDRSKPWEVGNVHIVTYGDLVSEMPVQEKANGRVFGRNRKDHHESL